MSTAETATKVVEVSVQVTGGKIVCSPDPVKVTAHEAQLRFTLQGAPGYRFRDENAIVVDRGGAAFPQPSQTSADGQTVTLEDCCVKKANYKYSVYLKDPSGRIVMVDPEIGNDPD